MATEAEKRLFETVPARSIEDDIQSSIQPKYPSRRGFCKYVLAGGALAAGAVFASQIPRASASYPGANVEIYKSVEGNTPTIDGKYDMTPREVEIDGKKYVVDEWNDATWIEIPKNIGKMDAYSAYKHDGEFLYIMHDIPQVTNFNFQGSAGTMFDPKHDGGTQQAKPDDFTVLPYFDKTFQIWMRYGEINGKFGEREKKPEGLIGSMGMSTSYFSSAPHLLCELKIPLSVGDLYKYVDSTIGICQEIYVHPLDSKFQYEDMYPHIFGEDWIVDNYADATFSKDINPNITTPPTIVPEFLSPQTGAVISLGIGSAALYFQKRKISRRTFIGLSEKRIFEPSKAMSSFHNKQSLVLIRQNSVRQPK